MKRFITFKWVYLKKINRCKGHEDPKESNQELKTTTKCMNKCQRNSGTYKKGVHQ